MQDTTTIRCSRCETDLPADAFHPSQRKQGAWCKRCRNRYANERNRVHHRGKPRACKGCGITFTRWDTYKHPGSAATRCESCYLQYVRDRQTPKNRQRQPKPLTPGGTRAWRLLRSEVIAAETICGFCHSEVDKALRYPHPLSPSIDHVIPISQGGSHDRWNLRLAHLGCNARAGQALASVVATERILLMRAALWLGERL